MKQDNKPVMSNTVDKHTPGPWYANSGMIYTGNHGSTIAVFYTNGGNLQPISEEEKEANMFLCAEAPTLKKENERLNIVVETSKGYVFQLQKENEELKERNRVLVEALESIYKIETIDFGLQSFDMARIKPMIREALQSNQ